MEEIPKAAMAFCFDLLSPEQSPRTLLLSVGLWLEEVLTPLAFASLQRYAMRLGSCWV